MTKLTDAELAEKVAVEVMGWKLSNEGTVWMDGKQAIMDRINWNPCNDWNDAMMAVKAVPYPEEQDILEDLLEERTEYFCFMTPRELTEIALKAKGVEV